MNSPSIIVLTRFKTGLVSFLDELINWMPDDEELLTTRILINDQLPIEEIMKKFIDHILPLESKISERDEQFFLDDPKVFGNVKDKSRVMSLKRLWTHPEFGKEDKDKAWKWMDFFIKCIKLYQHHS